jgi:hypothetical protein
MLSFAANIHQPILKDTTQNSFHELFEGNVTHKLCGTGWRLYLSTCQIRPNNNWSTFAYIKGKSYWWNNIILWLSFAANIHQPILKDTTQNSFHELFLNSPSIDQYYILTCGGGGQIPPFISVHFVDRYFSGQWNFEEASC